MKVRKEFIQNFCNGSKENEAIVNLLNYSMADINSYEELTDDEKKCIDKETFANIFDK